MGLVSLFVLLLCGLLTDANALTEGMKINVKREYLRILKFAPVYKMDWRIKPDASLDEGVDCSRLHYLVYSRAGILGLQRVISRDIAAGRGGWKGIDVELKDAEELDLPFFTFKLERPQGHTGVFIAGKKSGVLDLLHASSFYGKTVKVPFDKKYRDKLTKIRRITIGDKDGRSQNTVGLADSKKQKNVPFSIGRRLFFGNRLH